MKIINRHIFTNLLIPLVYLIIAFGLLFIIADLLENGVDFYKSNLSLMAILKYYGLNLPSYLNVIVPVCLLLSTLYSLNKLNRYGEITAMRASGISISKIIKPYVITGLFFTIAMLINSEFFSNYAYKAEQLKRTNDDSSQIIKEIDYVNLDSRHYWYIEKFHTESNMLEGITLRKRRSDGSDTEKISAEKAFWIDGFWWFQDISSQLFDKKNSPIGITKKIQVKEMRNLKEKPNDFLIKKQAIFLNISELFHLTNKKFETNKNNNYLITFHQKLSKPFICLIVILISTPIAINNNRKNSNLNIFLSLGLFFLYYCLIFFTEYLAKIQQIHPFLGCWSITILYIFIGIFLVKKSN